MATNHEFREDDTFDVVEALYHEAEMMLTQEERSASQPNQEPPSKKADAKKVIQSRKPRQKEKAVPIFTRISDLYEEAEAVKLLAQNTADNHVDNKSETPSDDMFIPPAFDAPVQMDETPSAEQALDDELIQDIINADDDSNHEEKSSDDEFTIPASFGETASDKDDTISEDEYAVLAEAIAQTDDADAENIAISDDFAPAISLDDAIDKLETNVEASGTNHENEEAIALAELDAARPQADSEMTKQLEDVQNAVANAQNAQSQSLADEETSAPNEPEEAVQTEDSSQITAGPELVAFIGETVREVLDEELPQLVRGLVDEALGERQGRYGRTNTPHIGLRTKPSRH